MTARKRVQIGILTIFSLTVLGAQSVERTGDEEEEKYEKIFDVDEYDGTWIMGDTDNDGVEDYALKLDERGNKRYEAVDFNGDGLMDDFYFYRNGALHREELDTNFDGVIDLWIYMHDGVRIAGYDRDTDYDGHVDLTKEFGEE
ncbi:MAG: hypothetical protein ACOC2V_01610 [Alkalispirochaeta sp.]